MPLIDELVRVVVDEMRFEHEGFALTPEMVLAFLDVEHKKEDERQVRELLKQRAGRVYGLYPELRNLLLVQSGQKGADK